MQQSLLNQMETPDSAEDNPDLSKVIERNIRTIIHLRIKNEEDSELADLEMETKPEDVLAEIERLQQRIK